MENVNQDVVIQLQKENKKILVDFFATWCMPCRQLIPKLETIERDYPNVTFVKVDVDQNMELAQKFGIRGVPTIMVFDGDQLIDRTSGLQPDHYYKTILDKL